MSSSTADTSRPDQAPTTDRDYELLIVSYRSADLVDRLLDSLGPNVPAVIVDNSHGVDGLDEMVRGRPLTRYLPGPGRGFSVAANIAVRTSTYDTMIIINPDCSPTLDQIDAMVADLAADPNLAQSAAVTVLPDGSVELGVGGYEPSPMRALVHAFGLHRVLPTAGLWARPVPNRPIQLDYISGSCSAVSRPIVLETGGFDEGFFVYSQDVAWGRALREAGYRHLLRTDILVPHLGGRSGDTSPRMMQVRGASMMTYVARHNSWTRVQAIRVALTIGACLRAAAGRVTRQSRGAADDHLAYARGLWRGLPRMV